MIKFGTDGVRGKVEMFTPEFTLAVARGIVKYAEQKGIAAPKVLLAGDTRESTEWILADFERALETLGVEYSNAGVMPTPGIDYAFYAMGYDYAIDVTASHNPASDNGVKIFERGVESGEKLSARCKQLIEEELAQGGVGELMAASLREDVHDDALAHYQEHLRKYVGMAKLDGLKIGLDCANGAMGAVGEGIFKELGAEVVTINADAEYGTKINDGCGSTHIEALQELVKTVKLDIGVAFDGDGDRCLMVDAEGEVVDGDQILVVLAEYLQLSALVATLESNPGLDQWAEQRGVRVTLADVGDEHVVAAMRQYGVKLGGEQCGHIILPGEPAGDGMLVGLMMAKAVATTGRSLRDLAGAMTKMPRLARGIAAGAETKEKFLNSSEVAELVGEYSDKFAAEKGRLLVRPSGTEPVIRITAWGESVVKITTLADELEERLKENLK